jgi:anti-anti-sigma factor
MPREVTRRSFELGGPGSGLDFEIRQHDLTVWVNLSGELTAKEFPRLVSEISSLLHHRGNRVVLDARRLRHIDYRTVKPLVEWNRKLHSKGQQLFLSNWNNYLRAILSVEDWDRELNPESVRPFGWRGLVGSPPGHS